MPILEGITLRVQEDEDFDSIQGYSFTQRLKILRQVWIGGCSDGSWKHVLVGEEMFGVAFRA